MAATVATTFTSQTRTVPYITNAQYQNAPTPVDTHKLVTGGTPQEQEAQLTSLINRASAWIDSTCMQVLAATFDTEQGIVNTNRYGELTVHPRYHPVIEVTNFQAGATPSQVTQVGNFASAWVEPKRIVVPRATFPFSSSAGPLQFGGSFAPHSNHIFAIWTYVNGFPVTTVAVQANPGDTTVTVADATGIIPGVSAPIRLDGGPGQEYLNVASVTGNVLTLTAGSPVKNLHTVGSSASGLPQDVEEACILATTGFIKMQGTGAVVASGTSSTGDTDPFRAGDDFVRAAEILQQGDYIRISIG
jgi:hypothetical protein